MARGTTTDFATTLGMLHTAVTNTGNDLRDALGKSVEKLETSGQAAQQETTRALVDELGRMRANLRETRDRLSTGGETLNAEVRQAVTELRTEMRSVREAVEGTAPPTASTKAWPPAYQLAVRNTPTSEAAPLSATVPEPTSVATATDHGELPPGPDRPTIPAQRDADDTEPGDISPSVELIQQAIRDALADQLAPLSALLAEKRDAEDDATAVEDDVRTHLREAIREMRGQLQEAQREACAELASLRKEAADLRAGLEHLRPQPVAEEAAPVEASKDHSALLQQAARVSSVDLLCHRDVYEFITAQAGRHSHFRVPPQVADEGDERIRAALSGRSLIALLISLHAVKHAARDGDGDRELATTLYERIQAGLTALTTQGQPVTITLDDRSSPVADTPCGDTAVGSVPAPVTDEGQGGNPQADPSTGDDEDRPS